MTLRPETEWVETVTAGWKVAVGTDKQQIIAAVTRGGIATGKPVCSAPVKRASKSSVF